MNFMKDSGTANTASYVFLKNPREIRPFKINKAGFGMMSAWLTVGDINQIKR